MVSQSNEITTLEKSIILHEDEREFSSAKPVIDQEKEAKGTVMEIIVVENGDKVDLRQDMKMLL